MRATLAAGAVLFMALSGPAFVQSRNTLDIYSIDVEGGQSTLFVSPSGESLLVDAGSPGERDADRIVDTAKQAGLTYNTPEQFIANLDRTPAPPPGAQLPAAPAEAGRGRGRGPQLPPHSPAYFVKVSVRPDGSFTVTNSRNGFSKQYPAGPKR
jgi:hypothetical protein